MWRQQARGFCVQASMRRVLLFWCAAAVCDAFAVPRGSALGFKGPVVGRGRVATVRSALLSPSDHVGLSCCLVGAAVFVACLR